MPGSPLQPVLYKQGSIIGPCLFIVYIMDLKPISSFNAILKYVDDTTLLVSQQNSSITLQFEFSHILDWSTKNKLKVNTLKTKKKKSLPPLLPEIERVDCAKILNVYFSDTLSPAQQNNHLISQCNQRLFQTSKSVS